MWGAERGQEQLGGHRSGGCPAPLRVPGATPLWTVPLVGTEQTAERWGRAAVAAGNREVGS